MSWPVGDFDELRRLRVLHAAIPGSMVAETVLPASFQDVWSVLADVEQGFPGLVPDVKSVHVIARDGERLQVLIHGRSGLRGRFDMVLRPGWCVMQNRWLVFGMAAVAAEEHTRFAYLAGLRLPGRRLLEPLLAPLRPRLARGVLRRFETRFSRQ